MSKAPLSGVRVLEFGSAIAGPLCTLILAELGAEVVKVEDTETGDDARKMGKVVKGESLYFINYNRNKQSIAINLKKPEGVEIVKRLLKTVDVVVENFRPGVLERLGLGYEVVKRINRKVIYCSITGFGRRGRYRNYRGYDLIAQAMSGLMWMNRKPVDEPMRAPVPVLDILAGFTAATAVCAALYNRGNNGRTVKIDVSLLQAGCVAMSQWITVSASTGEKVTPFGNRYPALAPYEPVKAKDGWLVVAVGNDEQWRKLCDILKLEELKAHPRFATMQSRIIPSNRDKIIRKIEKAISRKTVKHWVNLFQKAGVPAGPIRSLDEVVKDNALRSAGIFARVRHPGLGIVTVVRTTPQFEGRLSAVRAAPRHGEHTKAVLLRLGFSSEAVEKFLARGVIKCA
ncbi:MAG: CoA transferase [Candidatus Caldarchaeum sp.]|nr:CoA transferase [Candidatus Caldarchaeum sp.]